MKKGFTLIELLVVISIIGILAIFATITLTNSRIKSRDAQRVAYVNQINTALELYFLKNGLYPTTLTVGQPLVANGIKYLDPVLANPAPRADGSCLDQNFVYEAQSSNTSYTLSFCLGGATGNYSAGNTVCTSGGRCTPVLGYDVDALAYFDRLTGTMSDTDKDYVNTLITTLKAEGLWAKLDVLYLFAIGTNSTDALLNLKSTSFTATNVGSVTWTAYQGFTGAGVQGKYLNTNYNPTANAVNYSLNSGSIGLYVRNNVATVSVEMGATDASYANAVKLMIRYSNNSHYISLNDSAGTGGSNTDSRGMYVLSRTGANTLFSTRNGSPLNSPPNAASTSMPNRSFTICAWNANGSISYYSTKQIAVAFIASGLTLEEATAFSTAINTYMTSIGTNVY